jgi:hypothetical protein
MRRKLSNWSRQESKSRPKQVTGKACRGRKTGHDDAMGMTLEQIVQETSQWPADVVAELLDRITLAKHGGINAEREAAWAEVSLRRSAELDSGKEVLVSGHEVSARIRKIVGR